MLGKYFKTPLSAQAKEDSLELSILFFAILVVQAVTNVDAIELNNKILIKSAPTGILAIAKSARAKSPVKMPDKIDIIAFLNLLNIKRITNATTANTA